MTPPPYPPLTRTEKIIGSAMWVLAFIVLILGAIALTFAALYFYDQYTHDSRPVCTSAISSIRVVGNRTVRSGVVYYPKGCRHK
jgi:nitric oxide reductase large subunit